MKKIFLFILFLGLVNPAFAEDTVLQGNISFDWINKSQLSRDENIDDIKNIIYKNDIEKKYPRNSLRLIYKNHLKDYNLKKHYEEITAGKKENGNERLAGFYRFNGKIMYMYGIQYKDDKFTTYYYDLMGNLRYIDRMSENYPNFPYYSHQYRITGELAGSIYFTNYDTQYVFKNGKFQGVWYKDTMFDAKAKKIMTRTNY